MDTGKSRGRALRKRILTLLNSDNLDPGLEEICQFPGSQVVNPLFSFLYHPDPRIKWAAVTAMGAVVSKLAREKMESARIVMRRLMWNLNDESGGIGWGSPEAMGEIMACHEGLANEYAHVLISYTRGDWNYIEHEMLQRGLLWGIGRLAQVRPRLLREAVPFLMPYLESPDAQVRGLGAWVEGLLRAREAALKLKELSDDEGEVEIYIDRKLIASRVMDLAEQALHQIDERFKSGK